MLSSVRVSPHSGFPHHHYCRLIWNESILKFVRSRFHKKKRRGEEAEGVIVISTPIPALPSPPTPRVSVPKPETVTRLKFTHAKKRKKKETEMFSPLERAPFSLDYKVFFWKIRKQRNNLKKNTLER